MKLAPMTASVGGQSIIHLGTGRSRAVLACAIDDGALVAPDPGSALTLAFADQELADDAHSSFVPGTYELASVEVVGEGIRPARG
jgi:hypothetical protein